MKGHYAYVFLVSSLRAGTGFAYPPMFTAHTMISYTVGIHYILESILTYWATNKNNVYTWTVFTLQKNFASMILFDSYYIQVWMWQLDHKESWVLKNWCFWTVVLEKTLGSPLDCKEVQPVHPKGDQSWVFIGRTDAEAEAPILWPPDVKSWLIGKDTDAGKDWGQEEKGTTEDEMGGWHHRLNGHGFGWTPGVGDGQGGLACCSPWGRKESDMSERLNWTEHDLK